MTDQSGASSPRRPTIVANPAGDRVFEAAIDRLLTLGVRHPVDLEAALRSAFPRIHVRRREISGERVEVWYAYREGRWIGKD